MDILIQDIIIYIVSYLKTKKKIKFLSLSRDLHALKDKIYYEDMIDIDKIHNLWYFDKFTNVLIYDTNITYKFPMFVTHIIFGPYYNKNVKGLIPNSVTHLTFGEHFNQPINDCIPNSVTRLSFSFNFNQSIDNCIPNSVTHLTFGPHYDQSIKDCIPTSVTHLTIGN